MVLLWLGIKPNTRAEREKLERGIEALMAEDPALAVKTAADGTVRLGAVSEQQLEAAADRLAHQFDVKAAVTGIDIAYQEALTREAAGEAKYTAQIAGRAQYAHVKIRVRPGLRGAGYSFENVMSGAPIPDGFVAPI